jgi:hypothetical protein
MKNIPILGAAVASIFLCGCGETFSEVTARHEADFDALNADLKKIHEAIGQVDDIIELKKPLDPLPIYIQREPLESNTLVIFDKHLTDPDFQMPDEDGMTFYFNDLAELMGWTEFKGTASDDFESEILAVTGMRYVAVYRIAKYVAPKYATSNDGESSFNAGALVLAVYLYDREAAQMVLYFPVVAMTDASISVSGLKGADGEPVYGLEEVESSARSSLWTNARAALLAKLTEMTGGSFEDVNGVGKRAQPTTTGEVPQG